MSIRLLLILLVSLFSGLSLASDSKTSVEQANGDEIHQAKIEVFETSHDSNNDAPLTEEERSLSSIERFVQPFTRWAEDQIHDTGLIRSPQVQDTPAPQEQEGSLTLREAIQHATQRYQGTVLSADKIWLEDTLSYHVKIISAQGVVKTIKITASHHDNKAQK